MVGATNPERLLRVALGAARQASRDSDEHNLSVHEIGYLNEQWVQSYIGDAISRHLFSSYKTKASRPFVTYETCVSWLEYFFDQKRSRGRVPGKLTDRSRFDLTVWSKSGKSVGLIEVKDEPIMVAYSKTSDPSKLVGALKRWESLRWGIFLYSTRNATKKTGTDRKNHLRDKSQAVFDVIKTKFGKSVSLNYVVSDILREDDAQVLWAGVVFERLPAG
jgi:hypothetical protein